MDEVVSVNYYAPTTPPSGTPFLAGQSGGYYIKVMIYGTKEDPNRQQHFHVPLLENSPEIRKFLEMPIEDFRKLYDASSNAILSLLENLRLAVGVPCISNGEAGIDLPAALTRDLEDRLASLEVIRNLRNLHAVYQANLKNS